MPTRESILAILEAMSNALVPLAIVWHAAVIALALVVLRGWRPTTRLGVLLLAAPAISVSVGSLAFGNPFNGISFGALAVVLAILAGGRTARVENGPEWAVSLGIALILYGLVYPHFVHGPWIASVLAAPVGVVPCPTLAVIGGFTLVAGGFGSRAIPALLAVWTAFYALFGIFVLDVILDSGLVLAAGALTALTIHNVHQHSDHRRAFARTVP